MSRLPELGEAVERLLGHVGRAAEGRKLVWFFREDLVNQKGRLFVAAWRAADNETIVSRLYDLRRSQALGVALHAEYLSTDCVWCTIDSPLDPELAADHWIPRGELKLLVAVPPREAIALRRRLSWWVRRALSRLVLPRYPLPSAPSRAALDRGFED
jgi:hypothetical protein